MEKIDCRLLTKRVLANELNKRLKNYMRVYEEYYSTGSRDSAFLKDLVDGIQGISAVLEVYVENGGHINSDYAIKNLNSTKKYVDETIKYFESKKWYGKRINNKWN